MPYVIDKNNNHFLDDNGEKIEYTISYENADWYEHKEALNVNDNGHYDTGNKHIIIQDGTKANHPISKKTA